MSNTAEATIKNSIFNKNNAEDSGGAINSWNTDSLFIDNSTFDGNIALEGNGGAISLSGDENSTHRYYDIRNTTISQNVAGAWGGAINSNNSTIVIDASIFNNNESGLSGGVMNSNGNNLTISNSSFKYNSSNGSSAGVINAGNSTYDENQTVTITITDSEFVGNQNDSAGALRVWSSDTTIIKHTVFDSNDTEKYIGGSYISNTKYLEIDSCTITNNLANHDGAGLGFSRIDEGLIKNSIFANNIMKDADADTSFGAGLTLWGHANIKSINNTFVGNKAYKASAIGVRDSSNLELVNTIIWDNPGTTQLGLYIDGTLTAKNSVIGDGKASIDMDDMSKITSYDDQTMIETNPLLCDYWSGSWPQLAGNYHLTYLSPAIGKGENGVNMGAFDVGCDIDTALLSVDELIDVTPTEYALHDNYPNPFNPTTTLRFDLPEVSSITLTIYNMLGQRVRTFNMNDTPAGYHSIKWNATNDYGDPVGAGVYLYQLQANQYVKTRKMVLLK